VKQVMFAYIDHARNPFLEPTSSKQLG